MVERPLGVLKIRSSVPVIGRRRKHFGKLVRKRRIYWGPPEINRFNFSIRFGGN